MKVLYLFNRVRYGAEGKIGSGEDQDGHFFGMYRLRNHGIDAEYVELEQYIPERMAGWLREHVLNIYFAHLPLFPKMLSYDVVFTSTAFISQLANALWPFSKPKWVMFDFGLDGMLGGGTMFKQKLLRYMIRRSAGIITISKKEESRMKNMFPKIAQNIVFLPLGVDTAYFKPDASVPEEHFIFSPGRDPGRDFKTLAAATAASKMPVKITARPWNIKSLQPLPSNFSHHDFAPKELVEEYKKAELFVLPLKLDGGVNNAMGCSTLVEAMAMGKAIIATRTETTESYIEHGVNGILVPEKDEAALRSAIDDLVASPSKRAELGKRAREWAGAHCDADIFASSLAGYFKSITVPYHA
jgi:glycosyltransferase involved in cell wall biosynthesis